MKIEMPVKGEVVKVKKLNGEVVSAKVQYIQGDSVCVRILGKDSYITDCSVYPNRSGEYEAYYGN